MLRTVGTVAVLLAFVAWLVLSYSPSAAALPALAFTAPWATTWLPVLALGTLLVSAVLQAWLVHATGRSLRTPAGPAQAAALADFRLHIGREMVWTAAPLLMTLILAVWLWLGGR